MCASSCALVWIDGGRGRKFLYKKTSMTVFSFHQASNPVAGPPGRVLRAPSGPGNEVMANFAYPGYHQDLFKWATTADPAAPAMSGPVTR